MVLVVQANDDAKGLGTHLADVRVGVAAGRTVGNAVKRNRAKRLLRAAMQTLLPTLAHGWDLVLFREVQGFRRRSAINQQRCYSHRCFPARLPLPL